MPVMVLVWDWQLQRLQDQGIVVRCAQCQHPTEPDHRPLSARGTGLARCSINQCQVLLDAPLVCTDFKERSAD